MSRAPRVLVSGVVLGQPMGGVRRHNAELLPRAARILAREGGALAVMEGKERVAFELPPEVRRVETPVPPRPPIVRGPAESKWLQRTIATAARAGEGFDLVHTAHLPAPSRIGLRYTLTVHDLRALEMQHTSLSRRAFGRFVVADAIQRAALVITVSESVRGAILERFPLPPERVRVVPNAADHFEPRERRVGVEAPILYVGHLEPRKNLELLVRALAVDPLLPDLFLAGAPKRDEQKRLKQCAQELGVATRLRFLGPFEDSELPELYAEAACLVCPSRIEGFGIPVLEARRAGVPVAVARAGALVEVAGPDAPNFDPDDALECARALRAAIETPPDRLERSRADAARSSWERSAELLVDAWRAAVGTNARSGCGTDSEPGGDSEP